jgi:hypothetical protein
MKRLLLILILTFSFQSLTKADDIRDFQIEGMSIGDSALDYFTEKEIKDNIMSNYYKNKKFTSVEFVGDKRFATYENIEITFLTKDNNYIMESVSGAILCPKNFSRCKDLKEDIKSDISEQFKNLLPNSYSKNHRADKSGKSKFSHDFYEYENGDMIIIELVNWSKEITKKNRWTDNVNLSVRSNKFNQFLRIAFN